MGAVFGPNVDFSGMNTSGFKLTQITTRSWWSMKMGKIVVAVTAAVKTRGLPRLVPTVEMRCD